MEPGAQLMKTPQFLCSLRSAFSAPVLCPPVWLSYHILGACSLPGSLMPTIYLNRDSDCCVPSFLCPAIPVAPLLLAVVVRTYLLSLWGSSRAYQFTLPPCLPIWMEASCRYFSLLRNIYVRWRTTVARVSLLECFIIFTSCCVQTPTSNPPCPPGL